jgi:peptidoglycan hydrolase CwlO-like protein
MSLNEEEFKQKKEDLESKITQLEEERASLTAEVEMLRKKRVLLDLEKKAGSLQDSVDVLKREREDLQGQVSYLEGEMQHSG